MGHFIENLSDDKDVEVLEIFRADKFQDFSLFEWLGETPQRLVREHLFANSPKEAKQFEDALKDVRHDPIKDVDWDGLLEEERIEL